MAKLVTAGSTNAAGVQLKTLDRPHNASGEVLATVVTSTSTNLGTIQLQVGVMSATGVMTWRTFENNTLTTTVQSRNVATSRDAFIRVDSTTLGTYAGDVDII